MPLLIRPYTLNIFVINLPIYACKWSFLVQAGACLWAKCIGEPRAYSTSAVLPLPFVNMDPSKLSTMYACILLAAEQLKRNVDGIASLSSLTFHLKRQERWFWLRGNLLSFPASTFGSEDFTTCFRPRVRWVPLWSEMVPMLWKRQ